MASEPRLFPHPGSSATYGGPGDVYRYTLTRSWGDESRRVTWIMLNPSTATAEQDDPTIRRCIDFSKRWGYGCLTVVNIFAYRATDPRRLRDVEDPVGPDNDASILRAVECSQMAVAAWGNHGGLRARGANVRRMLARQVFAVHHLGITGKGQPKHPLYQPRITKPELWV